MNIVVLTDSGRTVTRPSTTLEKNGHDLFVPDFVNRITVSPALIINVSRPGRSIAEKFASRYADSITFGCLLYPENLIDGSPEGYACASCLDHTTHIGSENFPIRTAEYELAADGVKFAGTLESAGETVAKAIAEVSRFVFIRTGDVVAVELAKRREISFESGSENTILGFFDGKKLLDFKVID